MITLENSLSVNPMTESLGPTTDDTSPVQIPNTDAPRTSHMRRSTTDYWREQYRNEPYYDVNFTFADYLPAYLLGTECCLLASSFDTAEGELCRRWPSIKGPSRLEWTQARSAVRAGWCHANRPKFTGAVISIGFAGLTEDSTESIKRDYQTLFGIFRDDEYQTPGDCPAERCSMVAKIKVSAAATRLGEQVATHAPGLFPAPIVAEIQALCELILQWNPFLHR